MAGNHVIPRSGVAKPGWNLVRRHTPPFTSLEAFHTLRTIRKDPFEGPCKFACGTCLLCRIHERAQKHALLKKTRKKDMKGLSKA
jgi:hypothetical protein